jgi:hypothetical protein
MRKFFDKYEYFSDYEYPFGLDFLQSIFGDAYMRKYSLEGNGIFNIITTVNGIYEIKLTRGSLMLENDNKTTRDATKNNIVKLIENKLADNNIEYTSNNGKYITFKYNDIIFKLEIIKKAAMPR